MCCRYVRRDYKNALLLAAATYCVLSQAALMREYIETRSLAVKIADVSRVTVQKWQCVIPAFYRPLTNP